MSALIIQQRGEGPELDFSRLSGDEAEGVIRMVFECFRDFLDQQDPVEIIPFSVRATNVLTRNRLRTVAAVRALTPQRVARLAQCGQRTRQEIRHEFQRTLHIDLPQWADERIPQYSRA